MFIQDIIVVRGQQAGNGKDVDMAIEGGVVTWIGQLLPKGQHEGVGLSPVIPDIENEELDAGEVEV